MRKGSPFRKCIFVFLVSFSGLLASHTCCDSFYFWPDDSLVGGSDYLEKVSDLDLLLGVHHARLVVFEEADLGFF